MRLEDFKAHLRTIAGEDSKAEITGAARIVSRLGDSRQRRQQASAGMAAGMPSCGMLTSVPHETLFSVIVPDFPAGEELARLLGAAAKHQIYSFEQQ